MAKEGEVVQSKKSVMGMPVSFQKLFLARPELSHNHTHRRGTATCEASPAPILSADIDN